MQSQRLVLGVSITPYLLSPNLEPISGWACWLLSPQDPVSAPSPTGVIHAHCMYASFLMGAGVLNTTNTLEMSPRPTDALI